MALSATFTANFSSFYDAVDKAETKLKDFGAGAETAGKRLSAMGNQFSGVKIIQDATLMVKAIEDIGGTTKLTEKELAKLGSTANEAVAKMKALGMDVPKNLQKIADETKGANKATTDWMGSLTKIAGAVGIAFSVDAVVGFVGSVFDAASAVKDLGNQWGFTTQAVQKWTGAARDSGITTQALGKSVQNVTENLTEASPLYDALLKNIGLSGDALRNMKSEDAYKEVLTALTAVKDETIQYDMALAILGPAAKEVIGGIRDGLVEATDAQVTMSEETIKRLADAQDAWGKFKDTVIIYSGEMLAAVMDAGSKMTRSWTSFFTYAAAGLRDVMGGSSTLPFLLRTEQALDAVAASTKGVGEAAAGAAPAAAAANTGMKTAAQIAEELRKKKEALAKSEAARAKALAEAKRIEDAYTAALKKHDDALDDLVNTFSGGNVIGKANDYLAALRMSIPIEQMTAKQKENINKVMDEAIGTYQALGQRAPKVMYDIWLATKKADEGVIEFSSRWLNFAHIVNANPIDLGPGFALPPPPDLHPWKDAFTNFADTLPAIFATAMSARGAGMGKVLGEQLAAGISAAIVPAIAQAMMGTDAQNKMVASLGVATVFTMFSEVFRSIVEARGAAEDFQRALAEMTRDMHADLVGPNSPYEDFEDLEAAANDLGLTFVDVWNPDGVNTFGHHLQERIDEFELLRRAAEKWKLELTDAVDELSVALEDFGGAVPASLQPAINSLLEMKGIPPEIAALLGGLADGPAWQTMQARAKELGVDLAALGPKFQESRIHDIAFGYLRDLEMLAGEGSNVVLVLDGMKDELSTLYQDAQATGVKLPETLRPYMQRLVEMGLLMDGNKEKVEVLTDDMFADVEDKGLAAIVKILEAIKELLEKGLPRAAETAAAGVQGAFARHPVVVPYSFEQQGAGPDTSSPGPPEFARGTDGFVNFGKGTPVILHGWEAVVPRDAANATVPGDGAGAAIGGGMMTVIVEADGRQLSRIVAPFIPGEVRRLGLARG